MTVPGAADRDSGEGTPAEAPLAVQHRRVARASGDFVPAARLLLTPALRTSGL